jgi:hypothetical protein
MAYVATAPQKQDVMPFNIYHTVCLCFASCTKNVYDVTKKVLASSRFLVFPECGQNIWVNDWPLKLNISLVLPSFERNTDQFTEQHTHGRGVHMQFTMRQGNLSAGISAGCFPRAEMKPLITEHNVILKAYINWSIR